ncbi:MAG: DUF296 domain-containing protein [Aeromicrobium erythreum]
MTVTDLAPLRHPGPAPAARLASVPTGSLVHRASLPAGERLVDAIDAELARLGLDSAQVELLAGPLARVSYCFPALCDDGLRAAWYSETHEAAGPAHVLGGSATVGRRDGERFVHCHAVWHDALGAVHGGHLWPETVVGATPLEVVVHALDAVALTSGTDDETLMPVFTPWPVAPGEVRGDRRAVMTRVRPGLEVHEAVRRVMADAGFARASVRGSLGSIVGATLERPGAPLRVPGPATEVTVTGHGVLGDGRLDDVDLVAHVIDRHATVHSGRLAPTGNLVAITMELLVEELG